jgi:hypothetical protein
MYDDGYPRSQLSVRRSLCRGRWGITGKSVDPRNQGNDANFGARMVSLDRSLLCGLRAQWGNNMRLGETREVIERMAPN